MRFNILDQAKARDVLDRMDPPANERPNIAGLETRSGAGELLDVELIQEMADRLGELKERFVDDTQAFDAEACVIVHELIPSDEPELVSSDGFWRWVALGPLQEIVAWRFPPGKGRESDETQAAPVFNRQNFGVGASARQRSECYPYKLWLRGELGRLEGADPYRFAKRGDVDFWTSHILRQTYTTNRRLCAALVRFQYPDELEGRPRLISGVEDLERNRLGVRTLAKRIKRLQATCELSILDDDELDALVSELADGLTAARG